MILEMKKLTLIGHKSVRHKLFRNFNRTRLVEVVSTEEISNTKRLDNQQRTSGITAKMQSIDSALESIRQVKNEAKVTIKNFKDIDEKIYRHLDEENIISVGDFESITAREVELLNEVEEIHALFIQKEELKKIKEQAGETIKKLERYKEINIPLNQIKDTKNTTVILGYVSLSKATAIQEINKSEKFHVQTMKAGNDLVFIAVSLKEDKEQLIEKLNALEYIPCNEDIDETPAKVIYDSEKRIKESTQAIEKIIYEILNKRSYVKDLKILYDFYYTETMRNKALDEFATTKKSFVLVGYYPKECEDKVVEMLSDLPEENLYFLDEVTEKDDVPTLVKSGKIVEPYEYVTNLYSAPKYSKDLDPNPYMAFFYFLFFGMMVSDAMYGLILTIAAFTIYFIRKPRKGKGQLLLIIGMGGISTIIWGMIFGGYFGLPVSKWFGNARIAAFNPTEGNGPLFVLGISLALGFIQLMFGMLLKAIRLGKEKKYFEIFSSVVVWYIIFLGLGIVAVAALFIKNSNAKYVKYTGYAVTLAGVLSIFLSGMYGKKGAKKILGIFGGFGQLYGGINFLSDILSYARLFGLGLAGGVIAMVVNQICAVIIEIFGGIAGGQVIAVGYIIAAPIFVIGHGFNIGLSTLGAFVHNSRLQYIEFFGKFYEGGGHLFKPFGSEKKYTYIDLRR